MPLYRPIQHWPAVLVTDRPGHPVPGRTMNLSWAATGAIAALPAGTVLRGQVFRLSVRGGEPEEVACRTCGGPVPGLPATRCWLCGSWFGVPVVIELLAAVETGLLFARFGTHPAVAAFAYLGVIAVALTEIDLAVQRLPDRLTLRTYPAVIVLLGLATIVDGNGAALIRALLGGLVLGAGYLLVGLASGGQLGGGDIKLAGLVGLALGWLGWQTLITGASVGFVLAAIVGLALLATRRISRRAKISFGPFILGGALLAVLASR
jgi:leader peptidase (prepilin peptidase) / N-methyltransferase